MPNKRQNLVGTGVHGGNCLAPDVRVSLEGLCELCRAKRGEARRIINGAREQQASKKKGEGFSSVVASIATSAAEAEFSGKGGGGVSPPQQTPSISHAEPRSLTFLVYKSLSPSRLQLWESVFSVVAIELEVEAARSRPRFTKFFSNAVKGGRLGIWSIKRCRVSLSISSSRWK